MSNTQNSDYLHNRNSVIVRAVRNQPVKLTTKKSYDDSIEVVGKDENFGLCFPREFVYRYDDQLFTRLVDAYTSEETAELNSLWGQASHY